MFEVKLERLSEEGRFEGWEVRKFNSLQDAEEFKKSIANSLYYNVVEKVGQRESIYDWK